ncbi:MAG: hypothetical protein WDZ37_02330 [Solirubrobacterales bacterium]
MRRLEDRLPGATALLISAVATTAFALWNPPVRDLAAHTFRAEYFEQHGFAIWNGTWYAGHFMLTYSILFPPLSALFTPIWVGALSAIASAYLFDRLVHERWGEGARFGSYWFAALGSVAMLANGWLAFALGVAFALGALRAMQRHRWWLAALAALACALSSPVAALFLAIVVTAGWAGGDRSRAVAAAAVVACSLLPIAVLGLAFPEGGRFPYWFSAWWPLPLLCMTALIAVRGIPGERQFRAVVIAYLAIGTLLYVVPTQIGGNVTRMGSLFGGPALAAIVVTKRPRAPKALVALALIVGLAWQVITPLPDTIQSLGDPSTKRSYYAPLNDWLASHGGTLSRTEIPFTFNHWESAYVTPRFQLARGWLRQLDTERNELFYEGRLTDARYLSWLREKGVRYVAASDSQLDYSAQIEDDLIRRQAPYLAPRAKLEHWTVYEVAGAQPLVTSDDGGRARLVELEPQSFTLVVARPGRFTVRAWHSPYWEIAKGSGCVGRQGDWVEVRADRAGPLRVESGFTAAGARRAVTGDEPRCRPLDRAADGPAR